MYKQNTYSASEFIIEVKYNNLEAMSRIETYNWLRDFVVESSEIFMNKKIIDLLMGFTNTERERIAYEVKDKIRRKANIFAVKNTNKFYSVFFNNYTIESFNIHLLLVKDKDFEYAFKAEVSTVTFREEHY